METETVTITWKKVTGRHDLPRDGREFLVLWKGRMSLAQFDEEEGIFYIVWDPADCAPMGVDQHREGKFNYWADMPDYPLEYRGDYLKKDKEG